MCNSPSDETDVWLEIASLLSGSSEVSFSSEALSHWADPAEREENYHHRIRYAIETSDLDAVDVYGPEAQIDTQERPVDILLALRPEGELSLDLPRGEISVSEFIGIEVKTSGEKLERSREQLREQAESGCLNRLYACVPVDQEIPDFNRGVLENVGILGIDGRTGEIETIREAEFLSWRQKDREPLCIGTDEIAESDIQHAIWQYYMEQGSNISVEISLPRRYGRPDLLVASNDVPPIASPDYQSLYNSPDHTDKIVIEVKGTKGVTKTRLKDQIRRYRENDRHDRIAIGVPESSVEQLRNVLDGNYPEVGIITVSNARDDPSLAFYRRAMPLHRTERAGDVEKRIKCPREDCGLENPKKLLTRSDYGGTCLNDDCDQQILPSEIAE